MAAADDNSNTNTGDGPRPYDGSLNWLRVRSFQQLSVVMRFLSGVVGCLPFVLRQPKARDECAHFKIFEQSVDEDDEDEDWTDWTAVRSLSKGPTEEFTFGQMEAATMGFSLEAKMGNGSFGTVYRGHLPDGREVAIKRVESELCDEVDRRFQERLFREEVGFLLSRLRHKQLVHLVGYCAESDECLLVCEYMKNGALYDHLHPKAAPSESSPSLVMSSWKLRVRILLDASRGIEYLNSYAASRIAHVGIKSSDILLDASWRARLSGFGLSRFMEPRVSRTRPVTVKSGVYGFGVVMLEVLTGKPAILEEAEGGSPLSVVDYAVPSIFSGELGKVLDPRMPEPAAHEAQALGLVAYIAVHCVRLQGKDRPAMAGIVANLETAFNLCEHCFDGDLVKSPSSDSLPVITPIDQD